MSQQLQITGGAKVRALEGVITGTSGVLSSVPLGAANGVATLDSGGKVPVSQLPSSVVTYLGTWNAATNTPTLVNGTGDAGDMYICNVAGTVNFGAGPIVFSVGDWVLYGSGTWQKSNGQNGTVTSVAASITGNSIGITGSPISTAGTLAFAFSGNSGQYINGSGNLTTFPTLITEAQTLITDVYNETGATLTKGTVVYINGGHGNLPTVTKALATSDATSAQTYGVVQADITNMNNGHVIVIGSLGDLDTQAYANGTILYLSSTTAGAWTSTKQYAPAHLVYVGIVVRSHPTQGVVEIKIQNGYELDELHNVSAQSPLNNQGIFYNTSTSLWENKSIATALGYTPIGGSGSTGQVAFFNGGSTTLGGSSSLYWDNSTSRLGIGTNTPNASLGIVNSSSTGLQLRTSDTSNQYQANIYWDSSYGMVYGYNRIGAGTTANNITFYNSLGGFISVPESSNNNIGFNTINPQGLAGASVYDFTSLNTNVELRLHNSSTGYTSSDGSYIRVTSSALVIANAETSKSILINNGGNGVVTIDGTNKVAIGDIGVIPMTQQLTVVGSIEAYGGSIYQTVTSSMLKANASGQIIAAVGGTDYEYPLTFSSPLVRTTNTISMPAASTSVSGYLTSTDWNTFNNKGSGTVTSVSGTAPVVSSGGTTPTISMAAATTSVSGYLTSTDWNTFNGKFTLPSLTQGSVLFSNGSTIAQNNNRLYWDNTNMRFGVGSQSVSQYVMYVAANVGENANAWLGIDNKNATGSTAVRLILNGSTTSGFQYVQSTNMTQVYANAGDIQLINGSSLGLTIANTTGNATFSASATATSFIKSGGTSSQFLKADGSVDLNSYYLASNPSGFISNGGTGTTNYLPKYTGASTTGNSLVYDNGTNVIFGGTSNTSANPTVVMQNKLGTVLSVAGFNWAGTTTDNNSINSLMIIGGYLNTASQTIATATSASGMQFYNGGFYWYGNSGLTVGSSYTNTQRMFLTVGGNLIVGSGGDAGYKLDVSGTLRATGAATFSSSVTASSLVKSGGTSSQFLKADGSVDSTAYGTFTLPSLTSGSVLFSNGSTIAQDNANFYWDDTNNRLGIGTATPESSLHILGASAILYIDGNSAGTQTSSTLRLRTGGFNVGNFRYNVATDNIEISNISAGGAVTSGGVKIYGTGGSTTGITVTGAGNVGIGTNSPSYKFHVYNNTDGFISRFTGGSSSNVNVGIYGNSTYNSGVGFGSIGTESNHPFNIFTNGVDKLSITSGGELLVNTTAAFNSCLVGVVGATATYNLLSIKDTGTVYSVSNNFYLYFVNSTGGGAGGVSHATASTVVYYTGPSDKRLKSNIKDVEENVLPLFNNVKLKTYNHIADEDESVIYKGFLAQDMVDNFPEAYGKDKEGYYMYNASGYIPYLVKAISELNQTITSLQDRLDKLENK